jgi:hypothetical protein
MYVLDLSDKVKILDLFKGRIFLAEVGKHSWKNYSSIPSRKLNSMHPEHSWPFHNDGLHGIIYTKISKVFCILKSRSIKPLAIFFFLINCFMYNGIYDLIRILEFFFYFLLLCWVGVHCGLYKSLTIYQTYHSRVHPSTILFHSSYFWNSFTTYHISTYIHVYTVFVPYSRSFNISPPPHPCH